MLQKEKTVLRNFPVLGHFRYLFEMIRPEINQYFIESNQDGVPFSRELRSVVYQRAKKQLDTLPFGTQRDIYKIGHEWVNHSLNPVSLHDKDFRVKVGGDECRKPYSASILNISAMSYGSLSAHAIEALNGGAKQGGFAHNTGEGGVSPYHIKPGGDLIWQIGTGYFGCRNEDGTFDPDAFKETAQLDEIKMIEVKLSQGAKPGHGGILPAAKITPEIARIRRVPIGRDVISPPGHSAFCGPLEMMGFISKLRELSGGKPIGIKLCIGKREDFIGICKAMLESGSGPDYISIDGAEGGTGAAPLEFSNSIGFSLTDGLIFANNMLRGFGLRKKVRLMGAGKIITGFHLLSRIAIGADLCYSARGMMFSLGCIQALRCNSNACPVGVATNDPELMGGLDIKSKARRVASYHEETLKSFGEILASMGLKSSEELRPHHLLRRVSRDKIKSYAEIYGVTEEGAFLESEVSPEYRNLIENSSAERFA